MSEDDFSAVGDVDGFGVLLFLIFGFEVGVELGYLFFSALPEVGFLLLFDLFVEEELIVEIKVTLGDNLEE